MQCLSIWFHPFSEVVRVSFYCVHIIYLCLQKGEGGWGQHIISVMYTMMGGGTTGAVCSGPQCKGDPKQCWTRSNAYPFSSFSINTKPGWLEINNTPKQTPCLSSQPALIGFTLMLLGCKHFILHDYCAVHLATTRATYDVLFDLKLVNERWQLASTVCMHKRSPRTHFRVCKISKFCGGMPRPPSSIYIMGLTFCICPGPLQSSQWPYKPIPQLNLKEVI